MKKTFSDNAWEDYQYWISQGDKKMIKRVHKLIEDIERNGYTGIGKPEPLRFNWAGYWSRRITDEHRLVYKIESGKILFVAFRFHYGDDK
jgi:toxin YoeB